MIPAYEPNETLVELCHELGDKADKRGLPLSRIIVVNDGSSRQEAIDAIQAIDKMHFVTVIHHEMNRGKGAAIKTALAYVKHDLPHVHFVTTADADGQHTSHDILSVSQICMESESPGIGVRSFTQDVPLRSRLGNMITVGVFQFVSGQRIEDTQTGLRTYLAQDIDELVSIGPDGYAFEFDALFQLVSEWNGRLRQVPIETVYEPGNPTSHFRPLTDSLLIYAILLRHISVSVLSTVFDASLFAILSVFIPKTTVALVISRVFVIPFYFWGMRSFTFRVHGNAWKQFVEVALLVAVNIIFLSVVINSLNQFLSIPKLVAFLVAASLFYMLNFLVQHYIIFSGPRR